MATETEPLLPVAKPGAEASGKLGTFSGVFLPTALNVLSILMFLRFGFILGQMGVLGTLLLLVMSYTIDLLTTLSISAIATNGTVRGGGAYYMISRSLGPEFGGSIGVVFYVGQVLNSALNVVGLVEPIMVNFNSENGLLARVLVEGYWPQFVYATLILALCTVVLLTGAGLVAKAGSFLFVVLFIATLSVPVSTLFVRPFLVEEFQIWYSGPSWSTFSENLLPHFTKHAAGSVIPTRETFNDLFGIFFPATAGIFAGALMLGDLRKPSESIPRGTLWGLLLTFICYALVILSMGAAVPRDLLHADVQVVQTVNLSGTLILLGELATLLFLVIVGIVGAAYVLLAIAQDSIVPGIHILSKAGPKVCIILTWALTQVCLFADVNQIATFITMAFLMTFIVTNLACFLLKLGLAPNFRPLFRYFNLGTALLGGILCIVAMFIVDGLLATLVIVFLGFLFLVIHYSTPPKPWGDVSQLLIYHQVRKYLLRLRQDNVKYWRPQILLLVDDPRTGWNLIQFCNALKKGGLYILGHVIVTDDFQENYKELGVQQRAWISLRELLKIKAFVQIGLGPTLQWGIRNVYLGSGLGGMKPNITVIGFFDLSSYYAQAQGEALHPYFTLESDSPGYGTLKRESVVRNRRAKASDFGISHAGELPTDVCRTERRVLVCQWVHIVEDLVVMRATVAVAKGFPRLVLPPSGAKIPRELRRTIDLYPIQMLHVETDKHGKLVLSTNFDTYTLILQLGAILHTVPNWHNTHRLRIIVFVEGAGEVEEEKVRLGSLLQLLRIQAELMVLQLSSGDFSYYDHITRGKAVNERLQRRINQVLEGEEWWENLKLARTYVERGSFSGLDMPTLGLVSKAVTRLQAPVMKRRRFSLSLMQERGALFNMNTSTMLPTSLLHNAGDDLSVYDEGESTTVGSSRLASVAPSPRLRPVDARTGARVGSRLGASTPLKLKPNFSSVKIPQARINEEGEGEEQTIYFVPEESKGDVADEVPGSPVRPKAYRTPLVLLEGKGKRGGSTPLRNESTEEVDPVVQRAELEAELSQLSFNDLPARGQHLILNQMMRLVLGDAAVLFLTLPSPVIGTHLDPQALLEYVENIQVWCDNLPPVMLVNLQTVTVTTAL